MHVSFLFHTLFLKTLWEAPTSIEKLLEIKQEGVFFEGI
jgi:hypothetical protein